MSLCGSSVTPAPQTSGPSGHFWSLIENAPSFCRKRGRACKLTSMTSVKSFAHKGVLRWLCTSARCSAGLRISVTAWALGNAAGHRAASNLPSQSAGRARAFVRFYARLSLDRLRALPGFVLYPASCLSAKAKSRSSSAICSNNSLSNFTLQSNQFSSTRAPAPSPLPRALCRAQCRRAARPTLRRAAPRTRRV